MRGGRERQGGRARAVTAPVSGTCSRESSGVQPSEKFLKSRNMENGEVLRGGEAGKEEVVMQASCLAGSVQMSCRLCPQHGGGVSAPRRRR